MKIESFKIDKTIPGQQIQEPFIRVSNICCGLEHCNCSPRNFLTISDGNVGIKVELDNDEFKAVQENMALEEVFFTWIQKKKLEVMQ